MIKNRLCLIQGVQASTVTVIRNPGISNRKIDGVTKLVRLVMDNTYVNVKSEIT